MDWPDGDDLVKTWLAGRLGNAITEALTGPKLPGNLKTQMPLLIVSVFGGDSPNFAQDRPNLDVDIYAASKEGAKSLIGRIHRLMLVDCRNQIVGDGHVLLGVRNMAHPAPRPYDSKNLVWRYGASYTVLIRPKLG